MGTIQYTKKDHLLFNRSVHKSSFEAPERQLHWLGKQSGRMLAWKDASMDGTSLQNFTTKESGFLKQEGRYVPTTKYIYVHVTSCISKATPWRQLNIILQSSSCGRAPCRLWAVLSPNLTPTKAADHARRHDTCLFGHGITTNNINLG